MVTLLLTFFVMLLSLAEDRDPELFHKGRDAVLKSIRNAGLGVLLGKEKVTNFGHRKRRHYIANPDDIPASKTTDAEAEEIRRIIEQLKQHAKIVPLRINAKRTDFSVVNVRFPPGRSSLDEPAKKFLTGFCRNLQQDPSGRPVDLYVLGLANDQSADKEQWLLSARRAQAVADFLRDTLLSSVDSSEEPDEPWERSRWNIRSWGAGAGGHWVGPDSPISRQSQVLVGVRRLSN
jgi:outer membrane protein OmpA-like peptidoglycan-associated protein